MQVFHDDKRFAEAIEIQERRAGLLSTYTTARVRGDHRAGPVPVQIEYWFRFKYDEPWSDPESGLIDVSSTVRHFDTASARDMFVARRFELNGEWERLDWP